MLGASQHSRRRQPRHQEATLTSTSPLPSLRQPLACGITPGTTTIRTMWRRSRQTPLPYTIRHHPPHRPSPPRSSYDAPPPQPPGRAHPALHRRLPVDDLRTDGRGAAARTRRLPGGRGAGSLRRPLRPPAPALPGRERPPRHNRPGPPRRPSPRLGPGPDPLPAPGGLLPASDHQGRPPPRTDHRHHRHRLR